MGKVVEKKNIKKAKHEKGAITLYVLISIMFFLIVIMGIYVSSSNKIQKQEQEVNKIQKEYEKEDMNEIYEETYNDYVNTETPTIRAYVGDTLKGEAIGEKVSSKKNLFFANKDVKLKFLSKNSSDKYAYSTTEDGDKKKLEGNSLDVNITTEGQTIYVYIVDNEGNYSKSYTAVTLILVTLKDKTIYVEEGKEVTIGEIEGENAGNITFGQIEDSTIIKLDNNKVTGLKAGTTTLIATESRAGAIATITVKVVKIELATTTGTLLVGESKTVKITGTNNGTLSVKTSDESISTATINNDEVIITAKKAGNATITVTESNVQATAKFELKVASVALNPNGGTYTMPTEGNATIETTVITENAEKIEVAWSDEAGKWITIENNKLVQKTDCTAQVYYLYVRINGEAIYKSKEFIVGENTLETNKITIKPSTIEWTNEDVIATIIYGSTLTMNKKAGYGTSLTDAKNAASENTATSVIATANGYIYAEATDIAGNKIVATLEISNIDKESPTVTIDPNTGAVARTTDVTITASDAGRSGLSNSNSYQYYLSSSNTNLADGSWTNYTNGKTITIGSGITGIRYIWVKQVSDNAGNVSKITNPSYGNYIISGSFEFDNTAPTCTITANPSVNPTNASSITYTFTWNEAVIGFATDDITVTNGTKGAFTATSSTVYTLVVTTSANQNNTQTISIPAGKCTDTAGNRNTAASKEIKIDRLTPTVTFSPNTKSYVVPTESTQTISTTVTVNDNGGAGIATLLYSWSTSNTTMPSSFSSTFKNGSAINKKDVAIGSTYYLWIKAVDNVGNGANSAVCSGAFKVVEARWQNTVTNAYYNTLSDAVSGSPSGTNIILLKSYTDTTEPSISKTLSINLRGYTLTKTNKGIVINSGDTVSGENIVTIHGPGTITGSVSSLIKTTGTLNLNSTDSKEDQKMSITNSSGNLISQTAGTVNVGKYCDLTSSSIDGSTVYMSGGTFNKNASNSTISSSGSCAMYVRGGTANLNAGSISSTSKNQTIYNPSGTVNVQGATVSKTTNDSNAIYNSGTLNITKGTVTSSRKNFTVTNYGTFSMSGGTIVTFVSDSQCLANSDKSSATISGGSIYCSSSQGNGNDYAQRSIVVNQTDSTMTITGGSIGNSKSSYDNNTILGGTGIMVRSGSVTMTGGSIRMASVVGEKWIPARGVWITGGTFTLSSTSSSNYGTIHCASKINSTSENSVGVLLAGGTFKLQGYGHVYSRYSSGSTFSAIGYSILKKGGTYLKSGSPTIVGATKGI